MADTPKSNNRYDAILLDIEGTVAPISFVHDVLFPYVLSNLDSYLRAHYDEPQTQQDIRDLILLSQSDHSSDPTIPLIPSSPISPSSPSISSPSLHPDFPSQLSSLISNIQTLISRDRKVAPLKTLQGHMWHEGYHAHQLTAPLYPDVDEAMRRWTKSGVRVGVYSSGSVEAQKLIFAFTDRGDLTGMLSGYWDTHVGMKQEEQSYRRIMEEWKVAGDRLLFLTDVEGEARACCAAGGHAMIVVREGNKPVDPNCGIPLIHSFTEINVEQ